VFGQVSLGSLNRDPIAVRRRLHEEQGDLATFGLGRQRVICLGNVELIESSFVDQAKRLGKRGAAQRWWLWQPPVFLDGEFGLLSHDHEAHLHARRTLQPVFRRQRVRADAALLRRIVADTVSALATGGQTDLHGLAEHILLRGVSAALFDRSLSMTEASEFLLAYRPSNADPPATFFSRPSRLRDRLRTGRKLASSLKAMAEFSGDYCSAGTRPDSLLRLLEGLGAGRPAVVQSMLETSLAPASPAMTRLLMQAGEERVASRARQDYGSREGVSYAYRAALEALRLGAGCVVGRTVQQPFSLGRLTLRQGDWLWACPYLLHRDRRYFEQPEEFLPERWLSQRPSLKQGFIPFGIGSRLCMGNELMMALMACAFEEICRHWDTRIVDRGSWAPSRQHEVVPVKAPLACLVPR
jgi:cytochrome P450